MSGNVSIRTEISDVAGYVQGRHISVLVLLYWSIMAKVGLYVVAAIVCLQASLALAFYPNEYEYSVNREDLILKDRNSAGNKLKLSQVG